MADAQDNIEKKLSVDQALALFADVATSPEMRRDALSALMEQKALAKKQSESMVLAGRALLLQAAVSEKEPGYRLLAIAEAMRLARVAKREWQAEIRRGLEPAFVAELAPLSLLANADDRANVARACALFDRLWLPAYMARAIAEEDQGEKARAELISELLRRNSNLSTTVSMLAAEFAKLRPGTETPADTVARRLTRTLMALRQALVESDRDAGEDLGKALYGLVVDAFSEVGKPQEEKVKIDLSREVVLTVHDAVRTRLSVVAEASMYEAVGYCRRLCGGATWPKDEKLREALGRLIADVTEALLLLARQDKRDQQLRGQLDVLSDYPERARAIGRELALKHPELEEGLRYWLEYGRNPPTASDGVAVETLAREADGSIGLALEQARRVRALVEAVRNDLISALEVYEPGLKGTVSEMLAATTGVSVNVEQAARQRRLDLYGAPGHQIDLAPKYFDLVGTPIGQKVIIRRPAVVRLRSDGTPGDVVVKGLCEGI